MYPNPRGQSREMLEQQPYGKSWEQPSNEATNQPTRSGKSKRIDACIWETDLKRKRENAFGTAVEGLFSSFGKTKTTGNSEKSYYTRENIIIVHCLPPRCTDLSNTVYWFSKI